MGSDIDFPAIPLTGWDGILTWDGKFVGPPGGMGFRRDTRKANKIR